VKIDREKALDRALEIAASAADIVMRVYEEPFEVEYKGKNDPVTRADREANEHILRALATSFPGVPIVAEESPAASYAGFEQAPCAWFVDPLDGTREFVAKNGQFAVMIGLAEAGRATLGAIAWCSSGRMFGGAEDVRAFEVVAGKRVPIRVSAMADPWRSHAVVSRSHASEATNAAALRLGCKRVSHVGSAGLKAVMVACGEADVYLQPKYAGKRWDSCAPEAIVKAAGGAVTEATGAPFDYRATELANARGICVTNGLLHEAALRALANV
jgi:3'(2'), 5'-bisphosphate nucleotidase